MDPTTESAPLERYVVSEYLAEGGMGAIYLGKKLGAGGFAKEVVLKQLLPEYTRQPEFIDLFLREARLSANLDHANIIHTIDLVTAGDEYFIVMEYLSGADLRTLGKRIKRRRKKLAPAAAIYIAREVLSALAYAHAKQGQDGRPLRLIHRDVSPSNVLVSRNGEVKLTDFGIAKAATHTSVFYKVKGKVGYMSPEQARSEDLDHRSDLYSLAVCLHELISSERLFVVAGLTTTPEQIYGQPIPSLAQKVPGLPQDLDKIMAKALAIAPADRYQTASAMQEALLRCAHRNGLMMSAPELAAHLRQVCGPPEEWRETQDVGPSRTASMAAGGGTEVYDYADEGEGTEQVDASELDRDELDELAAMPALPAKKPRASSTIDIGRLQSIELTSMINLADLEQRGHRPLADWGDGDGDDDDDGDDVQLPGARSPSEPNVLGPERPAARPPDASRAGPARPEPERRGPPRAEPDRRGSGPMPMPPPAPMSPPAPTAAPGGPGGPSGTGGPGGPMAPVPGGPGPALGPGGPGPMFGPGGLGPGLGMISLPPPYIDPRVRRRRWLLSAAVALAVLAAAGIAAAVIGMSGPDVAPTAPSGSGGAPATTDGDAGPDATNAAVDVDAGAPP